MMASGSKKKKEKSQTLNNASPPLVALILQFLMFFSLRLYLCGCWVKATTVAEKAQNSRGWGRPAGLHVGCWAVRSVASLNHPLACGMEPASSCMPVVRAGPTRPQLFLYSSLTPFQLLLLFLFLLFFTHSCLEESCSIWKCTGSREIKSVWEGKIAIDVWLCSCQKKK